MGNWFGRISAFLLAGVISISSSVTAYAAVKAGAERRNDEYGITKTVMLNDFLINGGASVIINYSGADVNVNSMAGGVEVISCFTLHFQGDAGELAVQGQDDVLIPLSEVMNGRTLRAGERVQALYDSGNGTYLALQTQTLQDTVKVTVPYFPAATDPSICFIVAKTAWLPGAGYDYFAIGNSITMHPKREFWPDAMGMGATSQDKDYYHLFAGGLPGKGKKNIHSLALNFAIWEISYGNRASTLKLIDGYLTPAMDCVSIQLGDNVKSMLGFEQDFEQLVAYIRAKCPKARIIVIGNYWKNDAIDAVKKAVCEKYKGYFVDLSAIQNSPNYSFGQGVAVDANGVPMNCTNEGTAIHPNNAAMQYIATQMLSKYR